MIASALDILVTTKLSRRAAHSSHSAALRDRNIIITSNKYSGKLAEISADISSHSTEHRTAAGDIALLLSWSHLNKGVIDFCSGSLQTKPPVDDGFAVQASQCQVERSCLKVGFHQHESASVVLQRF